MALFEKKPKTKKVSAQKAAPKTPAAPLRAASSLVPEQVLMRPRVTEKSAQYTAAAVYTFEVAQSATKPAIAKAVRAVYGVTPVKVTLVRTPAKKVRLRTRRGYGTKGGHKKAYVFLKKGDRIEFST